MNKSVRFSFCPDLLCDPARVVFFKEKRVKKKAIGAGTVRHGRTISPEG
jgi:hypothetical protein